MRETHLKQQAEQTLQVFDRKQWRKWSDSLPRRARRLRIGNSLFKHLALERWTEAHELHRRALRNQSHVGWHSLRIGIKRFRYIVENFLPEQHSLWGDDLKKLQDLLGEVHDLDVLWATAQQINPFPDEESRVRWHSRISEERAGADRTLSREDDRQSDPLASVAGGIAAGQGSGKRSPATSTALGFGSGSGF